MLAFLLGTDLEQQPMSTAFQGEKPTTDCRRKLWEAESVSPHPCIYSATGDKWQRKKLFFVFLMSNINHRINWFPFKTMLLPLPIKPRCIWMKIWQNLFEKRWCSWTLSLKDPSTSNEVNEQNKKETQFPLSKNQNVVKHITEWELNI